MFKRSADEGSALQSSAAFKLDAKMSPRSGDQSNDSISRNRKVQNLSHEIDDIVNNQLRPVPQGKTPNQLSRGSPNNSKGMENLGFTGELCSFDK